MTVPTSPTNEEAASLVSKGPHYTARRIFNSQYLKIVSLVLLAICIPYNIYLSRTLHHEKVLRSNEFGGSSLSSSLSNEEAAGYVPAMIEDYIISHSKELGYENTDPDEASGCEIWRDPTKTTNEVYSFLHLFKKNLGGYAEAMQLYENVNINLMKFMREKDGLRDWNEVCKSVRPVGAGLESLFPSKQLSYLNRQGFLEPLLTPLRHPQFCNPEDAPQAINDLNYIVHDFEAMCLKLKPHSKLILIDAGASLEFHGNKGAPIQDLINTYNQFGFYFDHIYAFEVAKTDPDKVYNDLLPAEYVPSYHWINTGISADEGHKMNPLESIVAEYSEDDFIVFKLDMDTSSIEVPLARQLLQRDDINKKVDQFYFEHHVNLSEMKQHWDDTMQGTIKQSLDLMQGLRKKGVAAHYWV